MNYVDLDSAVAEALQYVANASPEDEAICRQFAWRALIQFGSGEDEIDTAIIKIKNLIAKKPANCRDVIELACYDSAGNLLPHTFRTGKKRIYPNSEYLAVSTQSDGAELVYWQSVDISEDRYNIIIGTNGVEVSEIHLRYYSYPLDTKGQPMIREEEMMAIILYIRYALSMRRNDNRSEIEQNKMSWFHEFDRVKAAKKSRGLNNDKRKLISRNWMKMLPSFNTSKF
jgi:hypothetical protein